MFGKHLRKYFSGREIMDNVYVVALFVSVYLPNCKLFCIKMHLGAFKPLGFFDSELRK